MMKQRRFGRTQRDISVGSLGTMRLPTAEVATAVVQAAVRLGITHIETAPAYGQVERYLGKAFQPLFQHSQLSRASLFVTTKITPTADADAVERQLEASLRDLGLDYVDGLAVHGLNTIAHLQQVQSGMLTGMQRLVVDGRVRHLGVSTHGPLAVVESAIATQAFDFINLHYYYFDQHLAPAVELAHQQDMGVFIISPADKGGLLHQPSDQLRELCAPFDPLALTYRWLLSDPRIATLSLGPANVAELDSLPTLSTEPLSSAEMHAFTRLEAAATETLGTDQCRQCYQCLPCPEAINIPQVLRLRNLAVAYDMTAYGQYRYRMLEKAGHWFPGRQGHRCTDCGDCLPRCPEDLPIPNLLRDAHERLKGPSRRRLWQ